MSNDEKIEEIVGNFIPNEDYDDAAPIFYFKNALRYMANWKEEQVTEKAISVITEIYEQYGYLPEKWEDMFKMKMED